MRQWIAACQWQTALTWAAPPPSGITLTATSLDLAAAARDLGDRDLLLTMAQMLLDEWNHHLTQIRSSLRKQVKMVQSLRWLPIR